MIVMPDWNHRNRESGRKDAPPCFLIFPPLLAISLTSASGNQRLLLPSAEQGQLKTSKKVALLFKERERAWKVGV